MKWEGVAGVGGVERCSWCGWSGYVGVAGVCGVGRWSWCGWNRKILLLKGLSVFLGITYVRTLYAYVCSLFILLPFRISGL